MKNKVVGIILILVGIIPGIISKDFTFSIISSVVGIGLIFSKTNYIG